MRRSVVENSLGKHTIRATRKQHKVSRARLRLLFLIILTLLAILLEETSCMSGNEDWMSGAILFIVLSNGSSWC